MSSPRAPCARFTFTTPQLPIAVLSDVQGNLPALRAVLEDIDRQGIHQIACLGGLVTFAPDPEPVLSLLRERISICLRGSYEEAILETPARFSGRVRDALEWQRGRLLTKRSASSHSAWAWLEALSARTPLPGASRLCDAMSMAINVRISTRVNMRRLEWFGVVQG